MRAHILQGVDTEMCHIKVLPGRFDYMPVSTAPTETSSSRARYALPCDP